MKTQTQFGTTPLDAARALIESCVVSLRDLAKANGTSDEDADTINGAADRIQGILSRSGLSLSLPKDPFKVTGRQLAAIMCKPAHERVGRERDIVGALRGANHPMLREVPKTLAACDRELSDG